MKKLNSVIGSVLVTWILCAILFLIAIGLGEWFKIKDVDPYMANFTRGIALSVFFGVVAWVMVRNVKNPLQTIGLSTLHKNITYFAIGISLLLCPLLMTMFLSNLFGWANFEINPNGVIVERQLFVLLVVFLFEAFPEEIIFRGVIYGKLRNIFSKWKSAIISAALFVIFPIAIFPLQELIIDGPIIIGGNVGITMGYLIYMTIFGFITAALREFSKNIWTSIGFHLLFVSMNHLMGIHQNGLIVITKYSNELPIQLILLVCFLLVGGLSFWYIKRQNKNTKLQLKY